jgi:hypothetical protein
MPTTDIVIWRGVEDDSIKELAKGFGWTETVLDEDIQSPTYGQQIPNPIGYKIYLRDKTRAIYKAKYKQQVQKTHDALQNHEAVVNAGLAGATD